MYCKKCGAKLPDGAIFCGKCGTRVTFGADNRIHDGLIKNAVEEPDDDSATKSQMENAAKNPADDAKTRSQMYTAVKNPADDAKTRSQIDTAAKNPADDMAKSQAMPWSAQEEVISNERIGSGAAPWKWLAIAMVIILAAVIALGFSYIKFTGKLKAPSSAGTQEQKSAKKAGNDSDSKKAGKDSDSKKPASKDKASKKTKTKTSDNKKDGEKPEDELSLSGGETPDQVMDDENGVFFPDSSSTALTDEDLNALNPQQLTYARNEIYARHGAVFKSPELNSYFQGKAWYQATTQVSDVHLSDIELQNASKILDYQKANNKEYSPQ